MAQEGHVRMLAGRLHAYRVGVGLRIDEARVSITGRAANALALPPLALVQHDPEWHVERPVSEPRPVVVELLDPGLVAHGGVRVWPARRGLRGILATLAVDLVEALGGQVIGLEVLVRYGPGWRHAAVMLDLAEVLTPQPEERGAEELGVAAHVVVRVRMKGLAVAIAPHLRRCVTAVQIDRLGVPVLLLPRNEAAPLEDEDALARGRQRVKERASAGSGPDDDHVVVGAHGDLLLRPRAWRPRPSWWSWLARPPARRSGNGRCSGSCCRDEAWRRTRPPDPVASRRARRQAASRWAAPGNRSRGHPRSRTARPRRAVAPGSCSSPTRGPRG